RTYVGGGSGVFTAIQGWYTVASGMFDVALLVAEEKMSSTQPHPQGAFLTIFDNLIERPLGPNLLWIFALEMNRYMSAYGLDKRHIATVAVKNKRNAADHPSALLGQADISVEDVLASETLAWPVQRLDVSPIRDGARRRPPVLPERGTAGRREPDRRGGADEGGGAVLAAPRRGRRAAGARHARAGGRAGVGRPHAGRDGRGRRDRRRTLADGDS